MTTTQIKYNKSLDVFQETNGVTRILNRKVAELENIISNLEYFTIALDNSKIKKTVKRIESLGFDVEVDQSWGFEWESKLYCSI